MNLQDGKLTDTDHDLMDKFLERVLNAYKHDKVSLSGAIGNLAHVMSALDKGNIGEAVAFFRLDDATLFEE